MCWVAIHCNIHGHSDYSLNIVFYNIHPLSMCIACKERKNQKRAKTRVSKGRWHIERGGETDDRSENGIAPPIRSLSVLPLITSLSSDKKGDYSRKIAVSENGVPPLSLNLFWQADQHHADLMFPFETGKEKNCCTIQCKVILKCQMSRNWKTFEYVIMYACMYLAQFKAGK